MTKRKPSRAVGEFREWLQAAVSCITYARLVMSPGGFTPSSADALPHTVTLADGPVRLNGPARVSLAIDHSYRIQQSGQGRRWKVSTASYRYSLVDEHGREILAYHWHPDTAGAVDYPHLHIGHGAVDIELLIAAQRSHQHNALRPEFHWLHLPTERIAFEDVIRLVIEQFDVEPIRADWDRMLRASRERFAATRTWS